MCEFFGLKKKTKESLMKENSLIAPAIYRLQSSIHINLLVDKMPP